LSSDEEDDDDDDDAEADDLNELDEDQERILDP